MYATLWMTAWYKAMGVGLTWNTEVSTKISYFDLVSVGDSSFIADDGEFGREEDEYYDDALAPINLDLACP